MASGPESGKRARLGRPTTRLTVPLLPPKLVPLRCAFRRLLVNYVSKTGKPLKEVSVSEADAYIKMTLVIDYQLDIRGSSFYDSSYHDALMGAYFDVLEDKQSWMRHAPLSPHRCHVATSNSRLPWSLRSKPCTVELPKGFEARNVQLAEALSEAVDAQVPLYQGISEAQRVLDTRIELEAAFGDAEVFIEPDAASASPRTPDHTPAAASAPAVSLRGSVRVATRATQTVSVSGD